jgi:hypothetical protein
MCIRNPPHHDINIHSNIIIADFGRVEGSAPGPTIQLTGSTVSTVRRHGSGINGKEKEIEKVVDVEALLKADPVTLSDLTAALQTTKPSSDGKMIKYDTLILEIHFFSCIINFECILVSFLKYEEMMSSLFLFSQFYHQIRRLAE